MMPHRLTIDHAAQLRFFAERGGRPRVGDRVRHRTQGHGVITNFSTSPIYEREYTIRWNLTGDEYTYTFNAGVQDFEVLNESE